MGKKAGLAVYPPNLWVFTQVALQSLNQNCDMDVMLTSGPFGGRHLGWDSCPSTTFEIDSHNMGINISEVSGCPSSVGESLRAPWGFIHTWPLGKIHGRE